MNLADGINFRVHPMAIEFVQVENSWSKFGIRLGGAEAASESKIGSKTRQKYVWNFTKTTEFIPVVHLYFDATVLKTILGI